MKIQTSVLYLSFQAGLTKQMQQEISSCNIQKISAELDKIGIRTDFKNNKVVAKYNKIIRCFWNGNFK